MTEQDSPQTPDMGGNRFFEEAADWFARMRGPDAEIHKPQFEIWLARGALHRAAYNRVAEIFSMGKCLEDDAAESARADIGPLQEKPHWRRRVAVMAMVVLAFGLGILFSINRTPTPAGRGGFAPRPVAGSSQLITLLGEIHTFVLQDGSRVTLDSNSLVLVAFDAGRRRLRLERGRARFDVAHEVRPFVVAAAMGTVTARGTIFDVQLTPARSVEVTLLRGRVDVTIANPAGARVRPAADVIHLVAGQQIAFSMPSLTPDPPREIRDERWTEAIVEFNEASLRDVIARANSMSPVKILLGDPSVGDIRISGAFRVNDADELTHRLALLVDLKVDRSDPSQLVLRR